MQEESTLSFHNYRLEPARARLWRGKQAVKLAPKVFGVLQYLAERPGQLVTKEELFRAIWPETVVTDSALTVCIKELRGALRDNAKSPRYIETVHGRGYRFIGAAHSAASQVSTHSTPPPGLVGRAKELAKLHEWFELARNGQRQIVFVSGEAGIGKTTLVETFLGQVQTQDPLWVGQGQCIEQYGAGDAYLPILQALGRLCRGKRGKHFIDLLDRHAPTWLIQMPTLVSSSRFDSLQTRGLGATKERMLRELAEALEAIPAEQPLVLVLEDLHWSDSATLEFLSVLARRQESARLLVIGTYRPAEVLVQEHPLRGVKQELQVHAQCQEMLLDFLAREDVTEYLLQRFRAMQGQQYQDAPSGLARFIHQRTDGNPLFMVNVVDYLVTQDLIREVESGGELPARQKQQEQSEQIDQTLVGMPDSLRQMIEKQIDRLGPGAQNVLEVASVAGVECSAAALAAGTESPVVQVEELCERLVRRHQFLQANGIEEWPDGTVASRYCFIHALYQEVLYGRVTGARRVQIHQKIGQREEAGYGERAVDIAAELAVHFERGRDYTRAVQYLQQAGEKDVQRSAHTEAIVLLTQGIKLLSKLPMAAERMQRELSLHIALGVPLIAIKGYAAPEVGKTYTRARELCQQLGETPQLFSALYGLWNFYQSSSDLQTAHDLAQQLLQLAQTTQDHQAFLVEAHRACGGTLQMLGEFPAALEHLNQGMALAHRHGRSLQASHSPVDLKVAYLAYAALVLWFLGYPEQALTRMHEALARARKLSHPFTLAFVLTWAAWLHNFRHEEQLVSERAEEVIPLCTDHGFPFLLEQGNIYRGQVFVWQGKTQEGITLIRQSLDNLQAMEVEPAPDWLVRLAEAYSTAGAVDEGISVLAEALNAGEQTGERTCEAEVYRLKGEFVLQSRVQSPDSEAEECFQKTIEIARWQSAKSWELRATMSLARLWRQQGKKEEARQTLAEVYAWFTEGFDTPDLKDARTLLGDLS